MNWTSTNVPLWQTDCENFRKVPSPFEVRDVTKPEHWEFVNEFAAQYGLTVTAHESTARFQASPTSGVGSKENVW